jgi:hypothetical protein
VRWGLSRHVQLRLRTFLCRRHKNVASRTVVTQGCLAFTSMPTMSQLDLKGEEVCAMMVAARDTGRGVPQLGWLACR